MKECLSTSNRSSSTLSNSSGSPKIKVAFKFRMPFQLTTKTLPPTYHTSPPHISINLALHLTPKHHTMCHIIFYTNTLCAHNRITSTLLCHTGLSSPKLCTRIRDDVTTDDGRCYFCVIDLAIKNRNVKDVDGKDNSDDDKGLGLGWCCDIDEVGWVEIHGRKGMERKHRNYLVRLACRTIS